MKKILLAEFVIICVTFSGVFLTISYLILLWTHNKTPPEMLTLAIPLLAGAFGAAAKARLRYSKKPAHSIIDYSLMGAAFLEVVLTVNYVMFVWAEKTIPKDIPTAILSLEAIILAVTTFGEDSSNNRNQDEN